MQHSRRHRMMQTTDRTDKERTTREEQERRQETSRQTSAIVRAFLYGPAAQGLGRILPYVKALGGTDRQYKVAYTDARRKLQALRSLVLARPDMHVFVITRSAETLLSRELVPRRIYQLQNLWTARVYLTSCRESASWLVHRLRCGKIYDLDTRCTRVLLEPYELYVIGARTYLAPCRQLLEAREQLEQMALHCGEPLWIRIRVFNLLERRIAALGGRVDPRWEHDRRIRLRGGISAMMRSRWPSAYMAFGKPAKLHSRGKED